VLPFFEEHEIPLLRVLTDRGTEYCGQREHHEYELNIRTLSRFFGETKLAEIDADKIRAYQRMRIQQQCGPSGMSAQFCSSVRKSTFDGASQKCSEHPPSGACIGLHGHIRALSKYFRLVSLRIMLIVVIDARLDF
jgi:hypothetical protein